MNTKTNRAKEMTMLALLVAIMLIMSYTPLGYLNIGPLAITFNIIPVAIAAIALGPKGGTIIGAVFGLTSFLQCIGIGGTSAFGATLFGISPIFTFIVCFLPRILDGWLLGIIFRATAKKLSVDKGLFITGFCSAFLNTLFFMTSLMVLFGNTDYIRGMMGGMNVIAFMAAFVGINAVVEILAATLIVGAVGFAMYKAKLITIE